MVRQFVEFWPMNFGEHEGALNDDDLHAWV